ncbi:MAG: hypothetical protein AAGD25_07360 [Cyanobacteria bacterium P01_F01_bin.150]
MRLVEGIIGLIIIGIGLGIILAIIGAAIWVVRRVLKGILKPFNKSSTVKQHSPQSPESTPSVAPPLQQPPIAPEEFQCNLPPFPAVRQPPANLPPGYYTFGDIWHWDGTQWHHESAAHMEPVMGLWGNEHTVTSANWEQLWSREQGQWSQTLFNGPRFSGIWGDRQHKIYAVGGKGTILSRQPGQSQWQLNSTPVTKALNAVWGRESPGGAQQIFAVGFDQTILVSPGEGSWTQEPSPVDVDFFGVSGDQNNVFVVGEKGKIIRRNQGGIWVLEESDTQEDFDSIWGNGQGAFYAVTRLGSIFYSQGDGQWTRQLKYNQQLTAVWGLNPQSIYVVGLQGTILWSNGNGEWINVSGATSLSVNTIWGHSDNELWIGGDQFYTIQEPKIPLEGATGEVGDPTIDVNPPAPKESRIGNDPFVHYISDIESGRNVIRFWFTSTEDSSPITELDYEILEPNIRWKGGRRLELSKENAYQIIVLVFFQEYTQNYYQNSIKRFSFQEVGSDSVIEFDYPNERVAVSE